MNGFGALWRLKTRRSICTMRSVPTATGNGRAVWHRVQETVDVMAEGERLKVRRAQHERRRVIHHLLKSTAGGRR
jgi:hypothetical protein